MRYEIKKIDILSVIKIIFIVSLFIGALIGIFHALIFSFIGTLLQQMGGDEVEFGMRSITIITPFVMILFTALFFAFFNSVFAGFIVLIYNVLTQWIGGIRIDLDSVDD
ncbi:DUF3566 domain-containing protein [candidate division KSB1 bacterium]|nr:DUF3566 domain-containing protein [candidate division KSB1 bacterium]